MFAKGRHWNPEKRAWRGRSYRKGDRLIRDLRNLAKIRADRREINA